MARMVGKAPLDLKITNGKQTLGSWSWNWKSNRIAIAKEEAVWSIIIDGVISNEHRVGLPYAGD